MELLQLEIDQISELALLKRLARFKADWIHIIASPTWLKNPELIGEIQALLPSALISGFSSPWQIQSQAVTEKSFLINAIKFAKSKLSHKIFMVASNSTLDAITVGEAIGQYLEGIRCKKAMLLIPKERVSIKDLSQAILNKTKAKIYGGEGSWGAPNWDSFIISSEGFSDNQILVLAFDENIEIEEVAFPNQLSKANLKELRGREIEAFICVEATHLSSEKASYKASRFLEELKQRHGIEYGYSGFYSGGSVGVFNHVHNESNNQPEAVITLIKEKPRS